MFSIPCETDDCIGLSGDGRPTCDDCHEHNGYPTGYTRSMDEAWLNYTPCDKIRLAPSTNQETTNG